MGCPLTAEEIADNERVNFEIEARNAAREDAENAKAEAKASVEAKLSALGLTPEEIAALR